MWMHKFDYQTLPLIRGPWPVRKLMALLMHGVWAIGQHQHIAPLLGKYWKPEGEKAGYFVVANRAVRST